MPSSKLFLLALVGLALAACGRGKESPPPPAPAAERPPAEGWVALSPEARDRAGIRVATAAVRPFAAAIETTGEVGRNEDRVAHVGPRVVGRITSLRAVLGQRVARGQALAVIDSTAAGEAQSEYLQARAREELARTTHERQRRLADERILAEQVVLEARAVLLQAEAARRSAEGRLRLLGLSAAQIAALGRDGSGSPLLAIAAPFDGVVVAKEATLGEVVAPEQTLFTVADLRKVWIWIDVFESDLRHVHPGDGADVQVDAFPGETFRGEVSFLSAQVDPGTRTVRARIDVANGDGRLRPGMFARVRLSDPHATGGTPVLVVPESAVQRHGDGTVVFVPAGEGRYRRREVKTGRRMGGLVEVLAGLRPGEPVVTQGTFLLASEAAKDILGEGE